MAPHGKVIPNLESVASAEMQQEFARLLNEKYDYAFKQGEIIKGKVLYKDANNIYVDVGAKTNALLPFKELENKANHHELEEGETFEFYILREEDEDGQLTLSRRRLAQAYAWRELQEAMDKETIMTCEVTSTVKGGLLVDILTLRGFVPSSHIRSRGPIEEMVGQTLQFKILSVDPQRNNIILSNKKVHADQQQEQRKEMFGNVAPGLVTEGEVVRITDFGAFVDIGGVDGLLPLSQMSWRWVEHPSDVLKIGDKVKVEVIGVDSDRQRISLSMKSQQADPWQEVADKYEFGSEIEGKLTRIKPFGAFVEIHPGVEALLPSREMGEFERASGNKLEVGSIISSFIIKFTPEERRISLGFQPYAPRPQGSYEGDYQGQEV